MYIDLEPQTIKMVAIIIIFALYVKAMIKIFGKEE